MMRLDSVELIRLRLPLASPFRASSGTLVDKDVLLVHVLAGGGEGWGECCALPEPGYSPEFVNGAHEVIRRFLLPRLLNQPVTAEAVAGLLAPVAGHQMAKAALEMAILDAQLRLEGRPLAGFLGGTRDLVDSGAVVGLSDSLPVLLGEIERCLASGYRRIKLKIEPGWDVDVVRAVRTEFGGEMGLQVDANGAYGLPDSDHLRRLDEFDLLLIEQPLPPDQLLAHARLAERLRTPVCLDESIVSFQVAADAIDLGACSVVCLKPGRVGGYLEARRIHDLCRERGVPVWCGGMLETGIGRAGNLALASLPGFMLPGDLGASSRYFSEDITSPFLLEEGRLRVPSGVGLGVEVHRAVIDRMATSVEVIRNG